MLETRRGAVERKEDWLCCRSCDSAFILCFFISSSFSFAAKEIFRNCSGSLGSNDMVSGLAKIASTAERSREVSMKFLLQDNIAKATRKRNDGPKSIEQLS